MKVIGTDDQLQVGEVL